MVTLMAGRSFVASTAGNVPYGQPPWAAGVADGDGEGAGVGDGPPIPPSRGRRLMPTTAIATTAAVESTTLGMVFMTGNLRAGHDVRRCGVAGIWSSTASRTRSGRT